MRYLIALFCALMHRVALAIPTEQPPAIAHTEMVRMLGGLLLVLLLILALAWIVKKLNVAQLTTSKGFQFIASMTLGSKEKISLLKVGERYLLMGITPGSITLLCDFGTQLPEGFTSEDKASFAELLKSAVGRTKQ